MNTKKCITALATLTTLAALFTAGGSAFAADEQHVALFKSVVGHVYVLRADSKLAAAPGMQLFVADRLTSDAGASAGLVFRDGTLLTLGAGSDVKVRDYVFEPKQAKYAFSVYLAKGSAVYSSGKIGKLSPESVKVDTPTSTVGVRGTRFIIEAQ
ncbi:MAG TPA: FecR family protein [Burkholderiaceae bacterium]|jgi:hypothetical protein